MKIAGELTTKDWKDLEEKLEPNNDELWGLAFSFFEERIKTRYLNPINAILDLKLNFLEFPADHFGRLRILLKIVFREIS